MIISLLCCFWHHCDISGGNALSSASACSIGSCSQDNLLTTVYSLYNSYSLSASSTVFRLHKQSKQLIYFKMGSTSAILFMLHTLEDKYNRKMEDAHPKPDSLFEVNFGSSISFLGPRYYIK
jgi:hypothetical protein